VAESGGAYSVNSAEIALRGELLSMYIKRQPDTELQALYAVQAFVHQLQHPPGEYRTSVELLVASLTGPARARCVEKEVPVHFRYPFPSPPNPFLSHPFSLPFPSPPSIPVPLEVGPLYPVNGSWGSAVSFPMGSRAGTRPQTHFWHILRLENASERYNFDDFPYQYASRPEISGGMILS